MGNTKSKPQINEDCPICYHKSVTKKDGIVLKCGHYFDHFCIQKHCLKTILNRIPSKCPLCNQFIKKSYIKKIYKKIYFITADPSEWFRADIHSLCNGYYFTGMKFSIRNFSNDITVIAPLFRNNGYNLPAYLYTPLLKNIKKTRHNFFKDNNSHLSDNLDFIPKLEYCIEGTCMSKSSDWKKFLIYLVAYLRKQKNIKNISTVIKDKYIAESRFFKEQKIRLFFTNNYSNINYIDNINYIQSKGYNYNESNFLKSHIFQFQPIIYIIKEKAYLINKITGLMKENLVI